jgi:hypothetical protein
MKRVGRFKYGVLVVWPSLWLSIAQSIVGLCTLGYYVPSWDIEWMYRSGQKLMR